MRNILEYGGQCVAAVNKLAYRMYLRRGEKCEADNSQARWEPWAMLGCFRASSFAQLGRPTGHPRIGKGAWLDCQSRAPRSARP